MNEIEDTIPERGLDELEIEGNHYTRMSSNEPCSKCALFKFCYSNYTNDDMLCESNPEKAKSTHNLHIYVKVEK